MKHSLADFTATLPPRVPTEPESPFAPVDEEGRPYLPMTLGPASNSGAPASNPMAIEGPGIDPGTSLLAKHLNWTVPQTDHPQKTIRVGDAEIGVDTSLAPLIRKLNAIGFQTISSCEGTGETEWAFVMFTENGGRAFARFWRRRLAPLGYEQPVLDHELRDADWRRKITRDFPLPNRIPVDFDGINFSLIWKLYRAELDPKPA